MRKNRAVGNRGDRGAIAPLPTILVEINPLIFGGHTRPHRFKELPTALKRSWYYSVVFILLVVRFTVDNCQNLVWFIKFDLIIIKKLHIRTQDLGIQIWIFVCKFYSDLQSLIGEEY